MRLIVAALLLLISPCSIVEARQQDNAKVAAELRSLLSNQPDFTATIEGEHYGQVEWRHPFAVRQGHRRIESSPQPDRPTTTGLKEIELYPPEGVPLLVVPERKQYAELVAVDPSSRAAEAPATLAESVLGHLESFGGEVTFAGSERIDGHDCLKVTIAQADGALTLWLAKDLRNLVIRFTRDVMAEALRNVSLDVPAHIFRVPEGFTKVSYEALTAEERARRAAKAKTPGDAYRINPTPDPVDSLKVLVPKTLEEAHAELQKMLTSELVTQMRDGSEKDVVQKNPGLGMWIRNNWGLKRGSPLAVWFEGLGVKSADDMSTIILETFWCRMNGKPLGLEEKVRNAAGKKTPHE